VVAEIKCLEASLLPQQHYHGATSPVQPFTKQFPAKMDQSMFKVNVSIPERKCQYLQLTRKVSKDWEGGKNVKIKGKKNILSCFF
jgi:hypothetical protein